VACVLTRTPQRARRLAEALALAASAHSNPQQQQQQQQQRHARHAARMILAVSCMVYVC
jgi:hypothetical protein